MAEKNLEVLLDGAGERAGTFKENARKGKAPVKITGVADPNETRRETLADKCDVTKENRYSTGEEAIDSGNFHGIYIATQDEQHKDPAIKALENPDVNAVLLEKPMANTPEDCIDIARTSQNSPNTVFSLFHTLRYADLYQKIIETINSGELGKLLNIDIKEYVERGHFIHSYVRGNWNREERSPVLLAKSVHDMDSMFWFARALPEYISSIGELSYFRKENAPEGALERCTDGCPVKNCLADTRGFYLNLSEEEANSHPQNTISEDHSEQGRLEALKTTKYGKCAFGAAGNNVCDWQDVDIKFQNGIMGSFQLRSTGSVDTREIRLDGEKAYLEADLHSGELKKVTYSLREGGDKVEYLSVDDVGGHGGGDKNLIRDWAERALGISYKDNLNSPRNALVSHLMAFAAEKSRKSSNPGESVNFREYLGGFGCGLDDTGNLYVPSK